MFSLLTLVIGGALETVFPKPLGVGIPVLLVAAQFMASRQTTMSMALFAIAAGAVEDALSSLPVMTSASYFLVVAMLTRWSGLPRGTTVLTYPLYQLWLRIWVSGLQGNIFHRILVAVPIGLATAFAVSAALTWLSGKVAIDEEG